jgi:hypothetical protein
MVGRRFLLVAFLTSVLPLGAKAGLFLGQTVQATYYDPTSADIYRGPWTAVVGPGVEFTYVLPCFSGASCIDVDVSDTNILVTMHYLNEPGDFTPAAFNGIRFYDLDGTIPDFTSVTINGISNMAGFDASRVTFDGNSIWVNFQGLIGTNSTIVSLDVAAADVPEPSTVLLVGLGCVSLLALRRRRGWRH